MTSNGVPRDAAPSSAAEAVLKPSDPIPDGAIPVQGLDFNHYADRNVTVAELVDSMATMGFQASSIGKAAKIVEGMRSWHDEETGDGTTIFLGYTSNLISSGLRETLRWLVQHKHVSAIVTTAGGVEEDFIKCLAPTYLGSFSADGATLRKQGMNRIGNLVVPNSNYCVFEDWVVPILDQMLCGQNLHVDDGLGALVNVMVVDFSGVLFLADMVDCSVDDFLDYSCHALVSFR